MDTPAELSTVRIHSMLIADHAELVNGKIYLMGGGFTHLRLPLPADIGFSLAFVLEVPWQLTNTRHSMTVELLDADGAPAGFQGETTFEVGRAVGVRQGSPVVLPAVMPVRAHIQEPGQYELRASVNGTDQHRVVFEIAAS